MKRLLVGVALAAAASVAFAQGAGGVMESQRQGTAKIVTGTIDGTVIGGTAPAAGTFTILKVGPSTAYSVGGGTTQLVQMATITAAERFISGFYFANDASGPQVFLGKSRTGTLGTYTYPTASDQLGAVAFAGADTSTGSFVSNATIRAIAASTWTSANHETYISLLATPNASITPAEQVRITTNGVLMSATGANQFRATQTTVPTITVNGGTSPACVGSDTFMICTIGTAPPAAATFTVQFNGTWASAPACIALRGTAGASPLVQNAVTATTTVQVNLSANLVASEKYHIHCGGIS